MLPRFGAFGVAGWEGEVGLYGASELVVRRFGGGLVRDQDPTEIGDDQASDAENVDFEDETLSKRLGRVVYNPAAAGSGKVWGVHRYYSRDGLTARFLLQAGTAIYEDNGATTPVFSSVHSLTSGGAPMDFLGWKERVYAGNGVDSLRCRKGSGAWSAVALLPAPPAPEVAPLRTLLETFESASTHATDPAQGWVISGNGLVLDPDTALKREGTGCLRLKATGSNAPGSSVMKCWSSGTVLQTYLTSNLASATPGTISTLVVNSTTGFGEGDYLQIEAEMVQVTEIVNSTSLKATRGVGGTSAAAHTASGSTRKVTRSKLDLSKAESVSVWVYSEKTGITFQLGVRRNDGSLDFADFYSFETKQKKTWVRMRVPLAAIPPAERDASPGLAIKFGDDGGNGYPVALFFDEARPEGPLVPDRYQYYATYAETELNHDREVLMRESNPGPAAELDVSIDEATLGVTVTLAGTAADGVNHLQLYRKRRDGPFVRARLVTTLENPGAGATVSYTDTRDEGELAVEDAPELVQGKIDPPVAKSYAVMNGRFVAGHVKLGTEWYPWRLYLSRLGYPEEFGGDQEPTSPTSPGWLDIATRDHVRRLVEFDGQLLVFCDRAIYTLEGSGWDDFAFRKRADVGLDARGAVAAYDRFVFFLASDGVRVLAPNRSFDGLFETWVVSEPVDGLLRAIPADKRGDVAFGLDERGRLHVSYTPAGGTANSEALVFDPTQGGDGRGAALAPGYQPTRPGWTRYTNWGFSCFCTLKRGAGDAGQLVGGDPATGKLHFLQRDRSDLPLETDDGVAVAWRWQGKALDSGPGSHFEWVYVGAELDAAAGQSVTVTPVLEGVASGTTLALPLGSAASGFVSVQARCGAAVRGRFSALRLSGSQGVRMKCRSARIGAYLR